MNLLPPVCLEDLVALGLDVAALPGAEIRRAGPSGAVHVTARCRFHAAATAYTGDRGKLCASCLDELLPGEPLGAVLNTAAEVAGVYRALWAALTAGPDAPRPLPNRPGAGHSPARTEQLVAAATADLEHAAAIVTDPARHARLRLVIDGLLVSRSWDAWVKLTGPDQPSWAEQSRLADVAEAAVGHRPLASDRQAGGSRAAVELLLAWDDAAETKPWAVVDVDLEAARYHAALERHRAAAKVEADLAHLPQLRRDGHPAEDDRLIAVPTLVTPLLTAETSYGTDIVGYLVAVRDRQPTVEDLQQLADRVGAPAPPVKIGTPQPHPAVQVLARILAELPEMADGGRLADLLQQAAPAGDPEAERAWYEAVQAVAACTPTSQKLAALADIAVLEEVA